MDIKKLVGANIRRIREGRGWSQDQLAEHSGLHRTYISGVERGVRNPTIEVMAEVASALGVQVATLFDKQSQK